MIYDLIYDLINKNRSYRRYYQDMAINEEQLKYLVELARLSPSTANLQPLKFILSWTLEKNSLIFPCLGWAGYLKDWGGPEEGEKPSGYITILGDKDIMENFDCNHGIAAQSILLGAVEMGFGGCIIASIQRDKLRAALKIPEKYEILLVITLGVPKELVVINEVKDGNIKYWRDEKDIHHVPKRPLSEIILDL
ncbi:MAG: nitroreductase family protein [Proteobacteria bacterium]|nr:nitroreductase family protein [Pseudomonadota bacterium]